MVNIGLWLREMLVPCDVPFDALWANRVGAYYQIRHP
jgi:hypothetical protein